MLQLSVMDNAHDALARALADGFAGLDQVTAVALGGSHQTGLADSVSDIDLYVYTQGAVAVETRANLVAEAGGADRADLGLSYWGPSDAWIHAPTGIEVDVVYFDTTWMEDQIARVVERHEAGEGYSTCFWHTLRYGLPLADGRGWLVALRGRGACDYPEPLRRNIIARNHPLLRGVLPAYAGQIEKAVRRRDWVSVNHRLAALLASYFDILFAVNRQLHPGEKRLMAQARRLCAILPERFEADLSTVLAQTCDDALPDSIERLLDHLDQSLVQQGLDVLNIHH